MTEMHVKQTLDAAFSEGDLRAKTFLIPKKAQREMHYVEGYKDGTERVMVIPMPGPEWLRVGISVYERESDWPLVTTVFYTGPQTTEEQLAATVGNFRVMLYDAAGRSLAGETGFEIVAVDRAR